MRLALPRFGSARSSAPNAADAAHLPVYAETAIGNDESRPSRWLLLWHLAETAADMLALPSVSGKARRLTIFQAVGEGFEVFRVKRGVGEPLGRLGAHGAGTGGPRLRDLAQANAVELRLDPEKLLRQRLVLPADSRDFLRPIIDHRLDRLTPWKRENIVYGFVALPQQKGQETIEIDFLATSRDILKASLERLALFGIKPTAVGSAADAMDRPIAVDLLQGLGDSRQQRRRKILSRVLLMTPLVAVATYLACLYAMFASQSDLDAATAALDAQRRAVNAGPADASLREQARTLIDAKQKEGAIFVFMDRLSEVIPDSTFLTDLEISPSALRIKGRSGDAPALIPLLEAEPSLAEVRFEAPVAREADGGDRFDLVAKISPASPAAVRQ